MPTRDTAWPTGTPCWVDYSATDLGAAQDFYGNLLSWSFAGGAPEFGGYLSCLRKDRAAAGMLPQLDPAQAAGWTTYFATEDADASVGQITKAGGTVVTAPMDVGPLGRMAIALDPEGNTFGLWQAGVHTGMNIYNEPGSLVWNDAAVDNPTAAKAFYGAVFGFHFDDVDGMGGYATFALHNRPVGGLGGLRPGSHNGWTVCFSIDSADDAVTAVQRSGGTVVMAATDTAFGRFAVFRDAWGATFSVMQELTD